MTKLAGFALIFILIIMVAAMTNTDASIALFVHDYHAAMVILMAILLSALLLPLFGILSNQIKLSISERIETKRFLDRARNFSPADKHVISLFVDEKKLTRVLDPSEPSVAWLESTKIILRGGDAIDGKKVTYRIALFAMNYFSKNPNLLR